MITDKAFVSSALVKLSEDANKYSRGSAAIFAGSYGMAGAAVLCGKGALKSGAGIVRLVLPESIYPICAASLLEAVYTPVKESECAFDLVDLSKADAVAFGCGIGQGKDGEVTLLKLLRENKKPMVIDADGINLLSKHIDILSQKACEVILTPHEGEFSRLINKSSEYIRANRQELASEFAQKYGVTLLLKGKNTVVAGKNGELMINPTGNAGLATAGSGDVLTGIITALMSQGTKPFEAAVSGAYIHGLSGDLAADALTQRCLTATDIIEYLPKAFKEC